MRLIMIIVLGLLAAPISQLKADFVTFTWTSTATTNANLPPGVSVGDSFELDVIVDNGGVGIVSQTWTAIDFVSAEAIVDGGTYTWSSGAGFIFSDTTGQFATDGTGSLTSVPTSWIAGGPNDSDTQGSGTGFANTLFLNGNNDVIFSPADFAVSVGAATSSLVIQDWAVSSIPEPGSSAIFCLAAVGLAVGKRRRD